ncbi:MAG: diaminopimelate decarboxylase [Acidobacteria bacterium RIFCSPLOWO2_02_FULL_65_29]|nr:MAG: diaminopimelate decarboxylase [Acidobacteria bacterium RIFCSPLOWO2_02_FULL_65_29]
MVGFYQHSSELVCDDVPLSAIAADVGTPTYVYSAAAVRERYRAIDGAFGAYPHALHYALKANSTFALVKLLRELGSAVDANSIGEIEVARRAGFAPSEIVFPGVGKSPAELECAVPLGLKAINVESAGELARVEAIAAKTGRPARVAVRVNPDIDARTHPHVSTGLKINKFGVPVDQARELLTSMAGRRWLTLVAIHVHVGSQITTLGPLRNAAAFAAGLAGELRGAGVRLEYLDLGGGLGIAYDGGAIVTPEEYVAALVHEVRADGLPIVIEPGRSIVGPAGVLVAQVVDLKPRDASSHFAVLDAGMTELLRPALYGAFHRIEPVRPRANGAHEYEVVGPVCESSDVVGRDRRLARLEVGDFVAIRDVGAYGAAMASNYNRRPLPAEVLVDEGRWRVIRRRQTVDDMLSLEHE